MTIVTSRDSLAGLVARDGAWRLELDVLPMAEAVGLLRALVGDRVNAEPDAAATLAAQCCGLPLALRVAADLVLSSHRRNAGRRGRVSARSHSRRRPGHRQAGPPGHASGDEQPRDRVAEVERPAEAEAGADREGGIVVVDVK